MKFAETIKKYLPMERARIALNTFDDTFDKHYIQKMRKKVNYLIFLNILILYAFFNMFFNKSSLSLDFLKSWIQIGM